MVFITLVGTSLGYSGIQIALVSMFLEDSVVLQYERCITALPTNYSKMEVCEYQG